jgi:excisionase family DNA binding protein
MEMKNLGSGAQLVGVTDAARFLSISKSTLYGWIWQRRIPFVKMGRSVRFDVRDLEQFIQSNRFISNQR